MAGETVGGVLIVGNFLSHALGTRSVCEDLAERLTECGWQVTTTSRRVSRVPRLLDMLFTAVRARHRYQVAQVDVFSGLAFYWAVTVCQVLRWLRKPYVLTLHGGNLPAFADAHPVLVRRLLRSAAAVTTPSKRIQQYLRFAREDICWLPNAIALEHYPFRARQGAAPTLVWLRAFHAIYNPRLAIETVGCLKDEFPDLTLTMYGRDKDDGSLAQALDAAERLGVRDRIVIAGKLDKAAVPAALDRHDIFLNTTNVESFGIAVLEAAALGLCVVTTDAGELPYLWTHDQDALIVPMGDAGAMAAAVRRLLTEPGLAERLSRGGRAAAEPFDWGAVLPQWESLLMSLSPRKGYDVNIY